MHTRTHSTHTETTLSLLILISCHLREGNELEITTAHKSQYSFVIKTLVP